MNFKQGVRDTWSDRWSRWLIVGALILVAVDCAGIIRWFPRHQALNPLHYTIYFGINLTGRWFEIFILPAVGFLAVVSHAVIGRVVNHVMWRRMWLLLALAINVFILADLMAVLYLVQSPFSL